MKVTLFDFNGVLVDDEHVHLEAFRDVLAPRGVTITDAIYLERYVGFDDAGAFRAILTDAGSPPSDDDVRALIDAKKPRYMARIANALRIFPGAAEIVRRRAALGVAAIVSGALEHEIRYCLDVMGVADRIAFIVAAERCKACKPDPEGYLLAKGELARLGVAPDAIARAVVVEDSLAGIRSARAAKLRCVAVAHSYPRAELVASGADAVVDDIASLTDDMMDA